MTDSSRRKILKGAVALSGYAMGQRASVAAEKYPDHAIKMYIPYPPAGAGDIVGRLISPGMSADLGQGIIVDNRGGGAQLIATELAAHAPPDGYTTFLASTTHSVNPGLMKHLPYDTLKDFASITIVASSPLIFVAHPSLGVSNIQELVALAKKEPGKINFASSGPGTGGHLSVELLKYMAGIDMVHVPYKGANPALTDLIAGVVQIMCTSPMPAMPHVRDGALKALAMTGTKRSAIAPQIPTVAESGYPGYQSTLWYALLTQSRVPAPIQKRLYDAAMTTLHDPKVIHQFNVQGVDVVANTPQEADAFIRAEIERWGTLIKKAGIKGPGG